jgi:hypothetical protein
VRDPSIESHPAVPIRADFRAAGAAGRGFVRVTVANQPKLPALAALVRAQDGFAMRIKPCRALVARAGIRGIIWIFGAAVLVQRERRLSGEGLAWQSSRLDGQARLAQGAA